MRSPRLYGTFLLWLLSELFETLPELGDPDPTSVTGAGAARLFEAVLLLVERATRRGRGLVLILEDLQWADASARALLAWLVGELQRVPVLLVATQLFDIRNEGTSLVAVKEKRQGKGGNKGA